MAQNDSAHESGEADEQLKKRARRRLVGAVALVLFAAIVLPMVMDHQPRPTNPEIQVRIPSQEAPAFEGRLPVQTAKSAAKAAANQEQKTSAAESTAVAAEKISTAPSAEAKPGESKSAEAKPEPKSEAKPESKPEPKPEAKPAVKAEAKPAPVTLQAVAGGEGEQWVVQLGAYQELGRVKLLTGKLKELGLPVFTEKVDTPQGIRTRVRAGPFSTKDAALKAQERAKIIGVTGPVAPK